MAHNHFSEDEKDFLCDLYNSQEVKRDQLPYTPIMDQFVQFMTQRFNRKYTHREVWVALLNIGKDNGSRRRQGKSYLDTGK